jgi:GntR family transcriptional regulator, transcriptional repressor for pyruvate dehydrogenase complex
MARAVPIALQPITTVRSYAAVAQQLQSLIASGEWAVGDRIPGERALAERFQVSRVVIRESMRHLETMGVIDVRQGSGTYVRLASPLSVTKSVTLMLELQKASYVDLMAVRRALELTSAQLAAERIDDNEIKQMKRCLTRMTKTSEKGLSTLSNYVAYGEQDQELHELIARASRNQPLQTLLAAIMPMLMIARLEIIKPFSDVQQFLGRRTIHLMHDEHVEMVEAIVSRNPVAAVEAMDRHLTRSVDFYSNLDRVFTKGPNPDTTA